MQEYNKQQYVDILTEQIRCRRARSLVSEEIGQHIEDQEQAYLREGMEAEAASREAVRQMGDPVEIEYTLNFYSETIGEKGQIPQEAAKKVLMIAAVLIVAGGILNHFVKKRRLGYTGRKK